MRWFWRAVYMVVTIGGLHGGYASLAPSALAYEKPDILACMAALIGTTLVFGLGTCRIVKTRGLEVLRRPSFDRNPFRFWGDPLQFLFVISLGTCAVALGAVPRLPWTDTVGLLRFGVSCSFAIGTLLAQAFVYRVFRSRILAA